MVRIKSPGRAGQPTQIHTNAAALRSVSSAQINRSSADNRQSQTSPCTQTFKLLAVTSPHRLTLTPTPSPSPPPNHQLHNYATACILYSLPSSPPPLSNEYRLVLRPLLSLPAPPSLSPLPSAHPLCPVEASMESHVAVESFVILEHAATLGTLDRLGWPAHTYTHTSIYMGKDM